MKLEDINNMNGVELESYVFSDEEKEIFLLKSGWKKIKGFVLTKFSETSEDGYESLFIVSEDFIEAVKKGEVVYWIDDDSRNDEMLELDSAFEYALEFFADDVCSDYMLAEDDCLEDADTHREALILIYKEDERKEINI